MLVSYFFKLKFMLLVSLSISKVVVYVSSQTQAILLSPTLKYWATPLREALLKRRQPALVTRPFLYWNKPPARNHDSAGQSACRRIHSSPKVYKVML